MDEILLYIVAGTETTAVTMMWYLKYMTNHPDVQHKLRAHLLERIPEVIERDITYDDVDPAKVPYMEAVVQECLRLSRTASGFLREGISIIILSRYRKVKLMYSNSGHVDPRSSHSQRHHHLSLFQGQS